MRVRFGIIILPVTLLLVACTSPHRVPEAPTPIPRLVPATLPPSQSQTAPTAPSATQSTVTGAGGEQATSVGDPAQGQQIFGSNCGVCHNLSDQPKVGPGLAGLFANQRPLPNGQPLTEDNLREWIHNGGGAMPGIPLGEGETNDLIAFLRQETQ